MLTTAQRIDLLKIALDIARTAHAADGAQEATLDGMTLDIFRRLKAAVDDGDALDDANMSDVKAAVDVASSLEGLVE